MEIEVDLKELKKIAEDADKREKVKKSIDKIVKKSGEQKVKEEAERIAQTIIRIIPISLKKAAEKAKCVDGKMVVRAEIFIAETEPDLFVGRYHLSYKSKMIFDSVSEQLSLLKITGVELKIKSKYKIKERYGPLIYYLEAKAIL